ncbi:MAG: hypothetical protein E7324_04335 [Clostridiales bacterium]|nr:hypothetical protein [Clostridiales bacterium]
MLFHRSSSLFYFDCTHLQLSYGIIFAIKSIIPAIIHIKNGKEEKANCMQVMHFLVQMGRGKFPAGCFKGRLDGYYIYEPNDSAGFPALDKEKKAC